MPRIKRIIPKGFTTVCNDFLRDTDLSLAARGLLMTMLSLPDGWNMSGRGLASILPDGRDKVFSTLKVLEEKGYLRREKIKENGRFVDIEYQFCDSPIFLSLKKEKLCKNTLPVSSPTLQKKEEPRKEKKIDLSSISVREVGKEEIMEEMNKRKEEDREKYVSEVILEKEKCVKEMGIPEKAFNFIVLIYTSIWNEKPEMRKTLARFSAFDLASLYEKTKRKRNAEQLIRKFFMTATPFWERAW